MMPKRVAETDPNTQITDTIGSGPFIFKKDEWKPGEKAVYVKNPKYKPRAEPASGLAGGKVAKVDRVEWICDPRRADRGQRAAQRRDRLDRERRRTTCCRCSRRTRTSSSWSSHPMGRQYAMRFNVLHKPFDNAKVRQAVAYALNQKDFLEATIGNPKYYRECKSMFPCGSPLEIDQGLGRQDRGQRRQGQGAAGRKRATTARRWCCMQSTDIPSLTNLAPVAKAQLEKAGFKVDLQPMDWQTLVARRAKKDPPASGGWSAFLTSWGSVDVLDPGRHRLPQRQLRQGDLRLAVRCRAREAARCLRQGDRSGQAEGDRRGGVRCALPEYPTHVFLGQYVQPSAFRKNISGVLVATNVALWNIEKK